MQAPFRVTCCWATLGAYTHTQRRAFTLIQSQYLSHKHPHTPLQAHPPPFASDTSQVGLLSDGESGLKEPVGFKRKTVSKEKQKSGRVRGQQNKGARDRETQLGVVDPCNYNSAL